MPSAIHPIEAKIRTEVTQIGTFRFTVYPLHFHASSICCDVTKIKKYYITYRKECHYTALQIKKTNNYVTLPPAKPFAILNYMSLRGWNHRTDGSLQPEKNQRGKRSRTGKEPLKNIRSEQKGIRPDALFCSSARRDSNELLLS